VAEDTAPAVDIDALPWVISVDDHVVEPPTVWTDRLSAADRQVGPGGTRHLGDGPRPKTMAVTYKKGGDGPLTDWWLYENLAKPVPVVVACAGIPVEEHSSDPIAYEAMRPGCYDPVARLADMDINRVERSLCFPSSPGSAARCSWRPRTGNSRFAACGVQRLDGRGVVRRLGGRLIRCA